MKFVRSMFFSGLCVFIAVMPLSAQTADLKRATLVYDSADFALPASEEAALKPQQMPAAGSPASATSGFIEQLLAKAGKKEQKIIRQILDIGQEKKLFNISKLEKKLSKIDVPAIMNLYTNLRALKISKLDAGKIDEIKAALAGIDQALAKADIKTVEFGNLSFFAAMTRDRMSDFTGNADEKSQLRASAMQNYTDAIDTLNEDQAPASQEKVDDAKERLETLRNPFGEILPLVPKKGKSQTLITSDYGTRIHPVKKTKRFHSGVDLAGWKCNGWKVLAIGPGRVVKSAWESGYGYAVIVSHDVEGHQYFSRYAHLMKKNRLAAGTLVKPGDIVGYCNNTGISTGAHLHFEVREGSLSGKTYDPKNYLPEVSILR
ncbi:MAG: M23 family metallopeptidase [Erysipelotrichia bacterium]|nr:M23 family metallopeptidase [Erysipelotrichia bacterium]